jgi:hypothetical protein
MSNIYHQIVSIMEKTTASWDKSICRGGLAIVAMWQLSRGFCNLPYKMSKKRPLRSFEEFFVWNAAEAF